MAIFISHITEEAPVALTLKGWIETTLLGQVNVFVSSDSDDIPAGDQWLDKINKALDQSQVMIILCSPSSIIKPWINFEAGCAWIRKIPIINLCHSGADKGDLPEPLSRFQNLNIEEADFGQKMLKAISKHLKLKIEKFPRIDYAAFRKELSDALIKISPSTAQVEPAKKKIDATAARLEKIEIRILMVLSKKDGVVVDFFESPGDSANSLASRFNMATTKMIHFLDKLADEQYVNQHYSVAGTSTYTLAAKGRTFLVENGFV